MCAFEMTETILHRVGCKAWKCADATGTVPVSRGLAISKNTNIFFQIKHTKAILSSCTGKLLRFEINKILIAHTHTHTHTRLTALFPGLPGSVGTRKVKPIWILLKQETVSGNGISWAICMSASRSRQITTPASHHSVFYRPGALPAAQPTASKHWRKCWLQFKK